jgi:hypothetical protein
MALGAVGGATSAVGSGLLSLRAPNEAPNPDARARAFRASIGLGTLTLASVVAGSVLYGLGAAAQPTGDLDYQSDRRHAFYSGAVGLYGVAALSLVGTGVSLALAARHPVRPYAAPTADRRGLTVGWEGPF